MATSFATGEGLYCYVIKRSLVVVDARLRYFNLSGVTWWLLYNWSGQTWNTLSIWPQDNTEIIISGSECVGCKGAKLHCSLRLWTIETNCSLQLKATKLLKSWLENPPTTIKNSPHLIAQSSCVLHTGLPTQVHTWFEQVTLPYIYIYRHIL